MNFCQKHWDELKVAINNRGLMKFVAVSGPQLAEHVVRDLDGTNTVIDFEPLLGSSICVHRLASNIGGLMAVMTPDADTGRPPCPVCFLQRFDWINAAADGALEEAKERGLL
jgi:hypothetical protein